MEEKTIRILGIDPGTKRIGIAVMQGSILREWRIKTFDDKFSAEKLKRIISTISNTAELYQVSRIALNIPPNNHTINQDKVIMAIRELAKAKSIRLVTTTTLEIKTFFGVGNKMELAETLAKRNNFLAKELEIEKSSTSKYYDKMFVAIGTTVMLYKKLDSSPR